MCLSSPKMVLSFAIVLACLGWLTAPENAMAQGMCQGSDCSGGESEAPCTGSDVCDIPCESQCGPKWSFAAEAIALQRTPTRSQPLYTPLASLDATALDARDMNFAVGLGYQLGAIRHDVCGCDWEINYFQVDGFTAETNVPGYLHIVFDANKEGWGMNGATAEYRSALYSGELNARRKWSDAFTLLAGFRMGQLNESLSMAGADTVVPPSLDVQTFNKLYGFQLGADVNVYDMNGPLLVNVLCKAGVFGNSASNHYHAQGANAVVDDYGNAGRNQTAFLGETGVVATYALTKRLAFRASAKAMWLTGMALAPEQISAVNLRTGEYSLNTSGAVFYYGGGMGLEYRY